jgi:hypothetical protein
VSIVTLKLETSEMARVFVYEAVALIGSEVFRRRNEAVVSGNCTQLIENGRFAHLPYDITSAGVYLRQVHGRGSASVSALAALTAAPLARLFQPDALGPSPRRASRAG